MRSAPLWRTLLAAALCVVPATTVAIGGPHAVAQPSNTADQASVTLAWRTLGVNDGLYLGPDSPTTVTVPVPPGLQAVRLQGTMAAPMNVDAGFLEISDGSGLLLA